MTKYGGYVIEPGNLPADWNIEYETRMLEIEMKKPIPLPLLVLAANSLAKIVGRLRNNK
jgi:hypothetical protein